LADLVTAALAVSAIKARLRALEDLVTKPITDHPIRFADSITVFDLCRRAAIPLIQAKLLAVESLIALPVSQRGFDTAKFVTALDFSDQATVTIFRAGVGAFISSAQHVSTLRAVTPVGVESFAVEVFVAYTVLYEVHRRAGIGAVLDLAFGADHRAVAFVPIQALTLKGHVADAVAQEFAVGTLHRAVRDQRRRACGTIFRTKLGAFAVVTDSIAA